MLTLSGMIPPMVSPLTSDHLADLDGVDRLTEHVLSGGASGLFVLGSSGEGPTLRPSVAQKIVQRYVQAGAGRVPILVGVGETSTERAIDAALAAEQAGADALVVMAPMYYDTDLDGSVVRHVDAIAARSPLPIVMYNIPHLTHHPITPEALTRVATIDTVVALKESSGDWNVFEPLLKAGKDAGLVVFQGAEPLIARSLALGCGGAVPGIGNLIPRLATELVRAGLKGAKATAERLQREVTEVCALQTAGFWLSALKTALSELKLIEPTLGAALPGLDEAGGAAVHRIMQEHGLLDTYPVVNA